MPHTLTPADIQRIEGRMWAEEAIAEAKEHSPDFYEGFLRQIKREFADQLTPAGAMTEQEAIAFEADVCRYRKHEGEKWGRVPPDYIAAIADLSRELLRYVKSERFKKREE